MLEPAIHPARSIEHHVPLPAIVPRGSCAGEPLIELQGIERRFGSVVALDGFDLTVRRGEILCLLGPNGAGKTTAVNVILGLAKPQKGQASVLGGEPGALATRRRTGAMVQIGAMPESLSVREHVELAAAWYGDPVPLATIIAQAGLEGLERRLFGNLSGGQQRRVLFAMAIAGAPEVLVLDEPTVALDVEARRALWSRVRELAAAGTAVLLTTHDLTEAANLATRVVVIHRGRTVADGTPAEVASLVGQRRIRCRTSLDAATVAAWPGVTHAEMLLGRLTVTATQPEAVLRRLLAADSGLDELELTGASLEDALVSLTQEDRAVTAAQEVS